MGDWVLRYQEWSMGAWKRGGMGMGLTEVSPPDPRHWSLTRGSRLVEVAGSARRLVNHSMGLRRKPTYIH